MKFLTTFIVILIASFGYANAKFIEESDLHFLPKTKQLMSGDIQYSFTLLSPKKLIEKFPEALELDSVSALQNKNVKILMTKSISIVNKPVGFFDHEHMKDERYISHIMGEQKINKLGNNTFFVTVPGQAGHTYKMKTFFDSDDISTLPSSRTIQGVTVARKLDVISQSASSIVFKEFTTFSKYAVSGTAVQSYISLKDGKTLLISYQLMAVKKPYAIEKLLKSNFLKETSEVKALMDNFQEK